MVTSVTFWTLGHKITGHNMDGSITVGYRKFRCFFGTTPMVCASAWNKLCDVRPAKSHPHHLLWALLHMKQYCIEHVNATLIGVSEKTFRKWSHIFIGLLARMPVVINSTSLYLIKFKWL